MLVNLPALLFVVPLAGALLCAVLAAYLPRWTRWAAWSTLAAATAIATTGLRSTLQGQALHLHFGGWQPPYGIEFMLDAMGALMAVVVAGLGLIALVGHHQARDREPIANETMVYPSALVLISGLMGMIATHDLFNLFVHLELVSLSAYGLVGAGGRGSPMAAYRYLIIGSLGASMYLLGVGFVYAATGTLNMADAADRIPSGDPRLILSAGSLMTAGLAVKMALFPVHVWMPSAYSCSPAISATLMAPLVTKVSAFALLRIFFWVFGCSHLETHRILPDLLCWTGSAAIVVGALFAVSQQHLRRLLVYSSVSQMGVIAAGIGVANLSSTTGAAFHIVSDSIDKTLLFLMAGLAAYRFGVEDVNDLRRLCGKAPWTSAAVAVTGMSQIGLPPLAGFFGKWYVLTGAVEAGRWEVVAAIVVGGLGTAAYVFRILELLYFSEPSVSDEREGSAAMVAAIGLLAVAVVTVGLSSNSIVTEVLRPAIEQGGN